MARREFDEILRAVRTVKTNRATDSRNSQCSAEQKVECSDFEEIRSPIVAADAPSAKYTNRSCSQERGSIGKSSSLQSDTNLGHCNGVQPATDQKIQAYQSELESMKSDVLKYKLNEESLLALLSEQRSSSQQRISTITKEVKALKHHNYELQSECNQLSEKIFIMRNETCSLQKQVEGIIAENLDLKKQLKTANTRLEKVQTDSQNIHRELYSINDFFRDILWNLQANGIARIMQFSCCRGQVNGIIQQISEALDEFSIMQAYEQTRLLAEELQSTQIRSGLDQCLRITEYVGNEFESVSGTISNLSTENVRKKVQIDCMIDERRKLCTEMEMMQQTLQILVNSCPKVNMNDSGQYIHDGETIPGDMVLRKSCSHTEGHVLQEDKKVEYCKGKGQELAAQNENSSLAPHLNSVGKDIRGDKYPGDSMVPQQPQCTQACTPAGHDPSPAGPSRIKSAITTVASPRKNAVSCNMDETIEVISDEAKTKTRHFSYSGKQCSTCRSVGRDFQTLPKKYISLSCDLMQLVEDVAEGIMMQQQALEEYGIGSYHHHIHLGIRKIESQTLDLELALRAARKAIQDFMGSSLLFAIAQERRERKLLMHQIQALNIEISSKEARIAAMHNENRSLTRKIDKMKTEQQEKSKIDDQLLALTVEREQMKMEYSSRLEMMHEAVIRLTEEGELMDASFSEEVRRRDVMIEEMKCYLLGEIQTMKSAMEQLKVQTVNSETGTNLKILSDVDRAPISPLVTDDSVLPDKHSEPRISDAPLVAPRGHLKKSNSPAARCASNVAKGEYGKDVPFFSDLLDELRDVLGEATNENSELDHKSSYAGQCTLASRVLRARSKCKSLDST